MKEKMHIKERLKQRRSLINNEILTKTKDFNEMESFRRFVLVNLGLTLAE